VPLFVDEALNQTPAVAGLALAAFAIGNVSVVMYSGRLSDRIGRRPLLIGGLMLSAVTTAVLGLTESAPMFFVAAVIAGAASGVYNSPQQAAVADIIGKARGGTAIATFQMMSDFGSIVGSFGVGVLAQQLSYGWAFGISGAILLLAAIGWMFAPETRDQSPLEHTPARPLGPEAAGELP
jgi:MFS family permease